MHSEGGATVDYIFYSPTCNFTINEGGRRMGLEGQRSDVATIDSISCGFFFSQVLMVL